MDLPDMPIGITTEKESVLPTLGITIENKWEGRIKKINRLLVYVPEGLALVNCDHRLDLARNLEGLDLQEGYTAYSLSSSDPITTDIAGQLTGSFRTFKCRIQTLSEPSDILGTAPIITKNFKVTVSYDYELVKSLSIDVKEGIGGRYAPTQLPPVAVTQSPTSSDITGYLSIIDTTKYNDKTYRQIIESSPGGKLNHELLAAIIVVATQVKNVEKTSTLNCAGITLMCGPLAARLNLCDNSACTGFDYRLQVDKHINSVAQHLASIRQAFTSPLNYEDKEKFVIASYAAGNTEIIKQAIGITAEETAEQQKAQTALKWEEVAPNLDAGLLNQFSEYQSLIDDERGQKAEEIKSYVSTVWNYKNAFSGKFN